MKTIFTLLAPIILLAQSTFTFSRQMLKMTKNQDFTINNNVITHSSLG